jgi:hypothetical protein
VRKEYRAEGSAIGRLKCRLRRKKNRRINYLLGTFLLSFGNNTKRKLRLLAPDILNPDANHRSSILFLRICIQEKSAFIQGGVFSNFALKRANLLRYQE